MNDYTILLAALLVVSLFIILGAVNCIIALDDIVRSLDDINNKLKYGKREMDDDRR